MDTSRPLTFGRHAVAVLAAAMACATLFAVYVGALAAMSRGGAAAGMVAGLVWLGTFVIAVPAAGLLFSIAWPVTRRAGRGGLPLCLLLGALGGFATMWTNHAAVGKAAGGPELAVATLLGAVTGTLYWLIARR